MTIQSLFRKKTQKSGGEETNRTKCHNKYKSRIEEKQTNGGMQGGQTNI